MARALTAGPATRRRAFFGLLDADGWGWASLKAAFWFVVIIFVLAYVPDRAYYFTVSRTIDLGILAWSPINLCPPNNEDVPCPAPLGTVLPWHASPQELNLPTARVDASLVQVGTQLLLLGGSDGQAATDTVLVARTVGTGNIGQWTQDGPTLPEARRDAAVTTLNGVVYAAGGYDASDAPTDTAWVLTPNLATGELGDWQSGDEVEAIQLPEARAGASLIGLPDGLLLVGGVGPDGAPTRTVWKSTLDAQGALGEWEPQREMINPFADGVAVVNGNYVWVIGGRDANGQPSQLVQRAALVGGAITGEGDAAGEGHEADDPEGSGGLGDDAASKPIGIEQWAVREGAVNLPEGRVDAMGLASNGAIYVIGGSNGQSTLRDVLWAVPESTDEGDDFTEWKRLDQTQLPEPGLARAAVAISGPNMFLVGGVAGSEPQADALRSNIAPEEPFFQLGLVGMTVPALKIEGEIGQQLGYLNAAGAGGAMFAGLIVIGYMFAHREQTRRFFERVRARGRGGRPPA